MDANDQPDGATVTTDVCIVGAGPAGIAIALELVGAGSRVLLLEAGELTETRAAQRMGAGESVGHPYFHLDVSRIRAFGGSSNHWREWSGLRARPLDPIDFAARPEVGRGGWPFDRHALESHYRRAQQICNLGAYDYEAGARVTSGQAEALDLPPDLAETVGFQVGPLGQFAARLPELMAADGIRLMLHANVLEVLTNDAGTAATSVVVGARPGHRFSVTSSVFVIATGGLENPRLLLASRSKHRDGLGNANDLVGRFFMEHPHVKHNGVLVPTGTRRDAALYERSVSRGVDGIAMIKLTDEVLRRERLLSSAWTLTPTSSDMVSAPGRALVDLLALAEARHVREVGDQLPRAAAALKVAASHPAATRDLLAKAVRLRPKVGKGLFRLSSMSEQVPNRSSRITLSAQVDRLGSRQTKLDWQLTDLDLHSIQRTQALLGEAFAAAGIGRVEQPFDVEAPPRTVTGGYHPMGTTRMAADPRQGVVDADCRVHGVTNLYVAGMSVFPTAGYANPTLTVVALAVRLAAHLRDGLRSRIVIPGQASQGEPAARTA